MHTHQGHDVVCERKLNPKPKLNQGHDVVCVDNLSRRNIDTEMGCDSLTPIQVSFRRSIGLFLSDTGLFSSMKISRRDIGTGSG